MEVKYFRMNYDNKHQKIISCPVSLDDDILYDKEAAADIYRDRSVVLQHQSQENGTKNKSKTKTISEDFVAPVILATEITEILHSMNGACGRKCSMSSGFLFHQEQDANNDYTVRSCHAKRKTHEPTQTCSCEFLQPLRAPECDMP